MNKSSIKLDGMDELIKSINELGRRGSTIENKALRLGAEPILKDAKLNAPVLTGAGVKGLDIGNVRTKNNQKYINIGIDKGDNSEIFYMKFHEFGTSKMRARPFLGPAYEKNKNLARKIIIENLKIGLKLYE